MKKSVYSLLVVAAVCFGFAGAEVANAAQKAQTVEVMRLAMMRENPGKEGTVVGALMNGTKVQVLGKKEVDGILYYKVKNESGKAGWVHNRMTREIGDSGASEAKATVVAQKTIQPADDDSPKPKAKKTREKEKAKKKSARQEASYEAPRSNRAVAAEPSSDIGRIESLEKETEKAITALKNEGDRIMKGIDKVVATRSAAESKRKMIELTAVSGAAKDSSLAALTNQIGVLDKEIERLGTRYREIDAQSKLLSTKLYDIAQTRRTLQDMRALLGSAGASEFAVTPLAGTSATSEAEALAKRIDSTLASTDPSRKKSSSVASSVPAPAPAPVAASPVPTAAPKPAEEARPAPQVAQTAPVSAKPEASPIVKPNPTLSAGSVPMDILTALSREGKRVVAEPYGEMQVARMNGKTVMAVAKANADKFRGVYGKIVKNTYDTDDKVYFVLDAGK